MKLPSHTGLRVAVDTEGSGLYADDGARISAVSCAWRDPQTNEIRAFATPFDQGTIGTFLDYEGDLPLGDKQLPSNHIKRLARLAKEHSDMIYTAPNRGPGAYLRLMAWLTDQDLVMHHKKYDCLMFAAGLRNREDDTSVDLMPRVVADTQLRQKVLDPADSSSLKPSAVRLHLGREVGIAEGAEAEEAAALATWKGPRTDPRYDLIPWEVLGPYSKTDAVLTLLLDEFQLTTRLDDPDDPAVQLAERLIRRQEGLSRVLFYMERRGVGFDREWCCAQDRLLAKIEAEAKGRVPFRPTPDGARKYFFGAPADGGLGLLPFNDKLTGSGRGQVDEDVIARLIKLDVPGAREYAESAEIVSARGKWYKAYPEMVGKDGRLRTTFRQGTVVTGRLAAERWQAHALPHDYQLKFLIDQGVQPIRYGFVARDGFGLYEIDVSQAEIRVATAIAKCAPMLRLIQSGADSHSAAALLMFYPKGTTLDAAKADPDWAFNRGVPAKRSNLGILYGGGVGAIHAAILKFAGLDVPSDQISEWIAAWRAAFPPFVRALDGYADKAAKDGWVRLIDGQVRYFSDYEPVHKAFNAVIQNSVAVAIEKAMIEVDNKYPGTLLLQIHDSLVLELPLADASAIVADVRSILIKHFERLFKPVPFEADVKRFGRDAYPQEVTS